MVKYTVKYDSKTDYPLSRCVKLCMYKQHHYDHHLKKQEEAWNKVKNEELNILQRGQQHTVEPASLRYKQIMDSNISDTQHKRLQAQG